MLFPRLSDNRRDSPLKTQKAAGIALDRQSSTSLDAEKFLLLRPQYRDCLLQAVHSEPIRQVPGQADEITRVHDAYPHLHDDDFVRENLQKWLND